MSVYGNCYRNLLWPVYEQLRGRQAWRFWREAEERQWYPPKALEQFQFTQLQKLVAHASAHSPWYRRHFDTLGAVPADIRSLTDFRKLPVLTKDDIRRHREEIRTTNFTGRLLPHTTGGSTGKPLEFYITRESYDWRQAIRHRAYCWLGAADGERVAYLWGTPITPVAFKKRAKTSLNERMLGRLILNTYSLTPAQMTDIVRQLNTFRPVCIVGYVSSLVNLAQHMEAEGLTLRAPQAVIATAESLFSPQQTAIERAFGAPVYNSYGSREFMNIATECTCRQGLHLNSDNLLVECLKDGQPCVAGELGELVITDLHNYGMPFLRYKIGDLGSFSDQPCRCGRGLPVLGTVAGRSFDAIRTPDGRLISGLFFTGLLLETYRDVEQLQVVQPQRDKLIVKLVVRPERKARALALVEDVRREVGDGIQVIPEFVDEIPLAASGKRRITISEL